MGVPLSFLTYWTALGSGIASGHLYSMCSTWSGFSAGSTSGKATRPGVSIPMEANLSRTTDMLSLWSGRYSSITSALLFLPSLLPVLRGM
uniref:Uncharacterized protein n=1 Tax=Salix viminalis TaxID=40686 RepID=A0A6N2LCK7_SALVM